MRRRVARGRFMATKSCRVVQDRVASAHHQSYRCCRRRWRETRQSCQHENMRHSRLLREFIFTLRRGQAVPVATGRIQWRASLLLQGFSAMIQMMT